MKKLASIKNENMEIPKPHEHLSAKAKALWQRFAGYSIRSQGRLECFRVGLESMNRADQIHRIIDEQGLTTVSKRGGMVHARRLFEKTMQRLCLDWNFLEDGKLE